MANLSAKGTFSSLSSNAIALEASWKYVRTSWGPCPPLRSQPFRAPTCFMVTAHSVARFRVSAEGEASNSLSNPEGGAAGGQGGNIRTRGGAAACASPTLPYGEAAAAYVWAGSGSRSSTTCAALAPPAPTARPSASSSRCCVSAPASGRTTRLESGAGTRRLAPVLQRAPNPHRAGHGAARPASFPGSTTP